MGAISGEGFSSSLTSQQSRALSSQRKEVDIMSLIKIAYYNKVCVSLKTERNNNAACGIRKLRWVFPTAMPAAQVMLATLGFPCVTPLRPMLLPIAGFSVRGVFHRCHVGLCYMKIRNWSDLNCDDHLSHW